MRLVIAPLQFGGGDSAAGRPAALAPACGLFSGESGRFRVRGRHLAGGRRAVEQAGVGVPPGDDVPPLPTSPPAPAPHR